MRRKTNEKIFPGFVRANTPDYEGLAQLVKKAIGNRSGLEFAQECNISSATVSKIINQKLTAPLSETIIDSIAKNCAPNFGVSLEALLEANGMVYIGENEKYDKDLLPVISVSKRPEYAERYERYANDIIRSRFDQVGIRYEETDELKGPGTSRPDAEYKVINKELNERGITHWCFEYSFYTSKDGKHSFYQKLSRVMSAFYMYPDKMNSYAYSIVTNNNKVIDEIICDYGDVSIPNAISILCVDVTTGKILREVQITPSDIRLNIEVLKNGRKLQ